MFTRYRSLRISGTTFLWVLVIGYTLANLGSQLISPLGQAPQLDSRELLDLGSAIADGSLAREPFYRAMGYPLLLSLFYKSFGSSGTVIAALGVGAVLHLLNTWLVGRLALRVWERIEASVVAMVLYGLNPVVIFFSIDVLDVALGITCALSSLFLLARNPGKISWVVAGGFLLGLSCVVRPHFLFLVPGVLTWMFVRKPVVFSRMMVWGLFALLPILIQATFGWRVSGEWHWMPWQGSFNLYSANAPDANGKYFKQKVVIDERDPGLNPARAESEARFAQATGAQPPFSTSEMSDYWRGKFLKQLASDPVGWIGLMGRKTYYLLNNFEQYNNKTYRFHAARRPLLEWNPLSWGMIFALAVGAVVGVAEPKMRRRLWLVVGLTGAYAIGVLLFYVSARFRLPMVAGLAVTGSGVVALWGQPGPGSRRLKWAAGVMLIACLVSYSRFFDAADTSTFVQDRMLLANASAETGEDRQAYALAREVWDADRGRMDSWRLALLSYFNLQLALIESKAPTDWEAVAPMLNGLPSSLSSDPQASFVAGVGMWNLGRFEDAKRIWTQAIEHDPVDAVNLLRALKVSTREDSDPLWNQLLPPRP